jgi:hypothetical protein
MSSAFLLSLLFSFLVGHSGNWLIDKLDLNSRYPKLSKWLNYRIQLQKFYFSYLLIMSICTLIFNLFININILFF